MTQRTLALVALCWVCSGCRSEPDRVQFLLPNDFRGAFAIKPDDPDGVVLVKEGGVYVVRIPENGVLPINGYNPFCSYLSTASFSNGDEIWVSGRIDDAPQRPQLALWGGHTHIHWDEKGNPLSTYWWFVGTEEEWAVSTDASRNEPGRALSRNVISSPVRTQDR
jgi:hypothetical protein